MPFLDVNRGNGKPMRKNKQEVYTKVLWHIESLNSNKSCNRAVLLTDHVRILEGQPCR